MLLRTRNFGLALYEGAPDLPPSPRSPPQRDSPPHWPPSPLYRYENTEWCSCNNCGISENGTEGECNCCREMGTVLTRVQPAGCITEHPEFLMPCLNISVLRLLYFELRGLGYPMHDDIQREGLRPRNSRSAKPWAAGEACFCETRVVVPSLLTRERKQVQLNSLEIKRRCIKGLINTHLASQPEHLALTLSGRIVLSSLGIPVPASQCETIQLLLALRDKIQVAPIPRNMNPSLHPVCWMAPGLLILLGPIM
ncbi:hypothetical protein HPB47_011151 [Ixodes persulcatus]|uniref:Uncharacterized protein n=1 Tax=Ixodes persulcatus TaxID=34615 RepID=A0AC60NX35_IXOPE|nr:hypothetical protein HPB47_011151 [Ixodes persulcatus]